MVWYVNYISVKKFLSMIFGICNRSTSASSLQWLIFKHKMCFWQKYDSRHIFLLIAWLLGLGLPVWSWIQMVRMGTLVMFLILEEKCVILCYWVRYWLWVCYIWPLLGWSAFLISNLLRVFIFNVCWILLNAFSASTERIIFLSLKIWIYVHILYMYIHTYIME